MENCLPSSSSLKQLGDRPTQMPTRRTNALFAAAALAVAAAYSRGEPPPQRYAQKSPPQTARARPRTLPTQLRPNRVPASTTAAHLSPPRSQRWASAPRLPPRASSARRMRARGAADAAAGVARGGAVDAGRRRHVHGVEAGGPQGGARRPGRSHDVQGGVRRARVAVPVVAHRRVQAHQRRPARRGRRVLGLHPRGAARPRELRAVQEGRRRTRTSSSARSSSSRSSPTRSRRSSSPSATASTPSASSRRCRA